MKRQISLNTWHWDLPEGNENKTNLMLNLNSCWNKIAIQKLNLSLKALEYEFTDTKHLFNLNIASKFYELEYSFKD